MKKLSDSSLFAEILNNGKLATNLKSLNIVRDKVDLKTLEEPLNIINKKFNVATKGKVLELLNKEKIIIVSNPEYSLPRYLNVFGRPYNNDLIIMVDITKYAVVRSSGNIEIYPKTLYGLLQNAMVLYELINNFNRYMINMNILKNSAISYSKLFCKILDKTFAINIDPVKSDIISFYVAKYFLKNICNKDNEETINTLAYNSCFNGTKLSIILEQESLFEENYCENIMIFFNNLSKINGLENLKIRSFVEQYVRMYGEGTILALDYLPAFLGMIFSVSIGCNLHRDFLVDSVSGKFNYKVLTEFSKLLR